MDPKEIIAEATREALKHHVGVLTSEELEAARALMRRTLEEFKGEPVFRGRIDNFVVEDTLEGVKVTGTWYLHEPSTSSSPRRA